VNRTPAPPVITLADVEAALCASTTTDSKRKSRKAPVRMTEAQKNSVIYACNCFVRWARSELALVEADAPPGKQKVSQQKSVALRKSATSSWTKAKIKRQNKPYEALLEHITRFLSDSRNWDLPEGADPDDLRPLQDVLNDAGWLLTQIVNQPILEPTLSVTAFDRWLTMLSSIWIAAGGGPPSGEEQTLFFRF
jgi:hypothetical protein